MFFQTVDKLFDIGLENRTTAKNDDPNRISYTVTVSGHSDNMFLCIPS
jgi:hypothetical protein